MHGLSHTDEIVGAVVGLLLVASLILIVSKRIRLPFTVILVLVGMLLALLADAYPLLAPLHRMEISTDLILYVFLPTLIFESAYNMDSRSLRHNLGPILLLAVPGLVISTALIGLLVWWATAIPLTAALLLGAILSATDPVAVIALFARLGAPQRLTTLVEGESLFNDATSIVMAGIILGVLSAGSISTDSVVHGLQQFCVLFFGGALLGAVLGMLAAWLIGMFESETLVEISLVTSLAYIAFLLAEELFHVSGVMATVGAGLVMGGWGRSKVSSSVAVYLEYFLELLAFVATALIFLMVGLAVDIGSLAASLDVLLWVLIGMLVARAAIIFGMMPLVAHLPGSGPISPAYQTVMFWGGLRGAIALAIVLSLPPFPYSEQFIALVMGAVLFTLLVQGLTIDPLVRRLKLHEPTLADRVASLERELMARNRAFARIPELQAGGLFSSSIARRLQQECGRGIEEARRAIRKLRRHELDRESELNLLYLRAFAEERAVYTQMYAKGNLSEGAFRELMLVLSLQIDAIRNRIDFQQVHSHRTLIGLEHLFYRHFGRLPGFAQLGERMRMRRIIRNYEEVWGHFQGSGNVIRYLESLEDLESIPKPVYREVMDHYQHWHLLAGQQLDQVSEQFPEFVESMQERLGRRLMLLAEMEATHEQVERGLLPRGVAHEIEADISRRLAALRGQSIARLYSDPMALLRRVPLFRELSDAELASLAGYLRPLSYPEKELLVAQGEEGGSLYLIARGVVRVCREEGEHTHELGTLMAGDFFGEMALMRHASRAASVRTVTPCQLYELQSEDLQQVVDSHPAIGERLRRTDAQRRQEAERLAEASGREKG